MLLSQLGAAPHYRNNEPLCAAVAGLCRDLCGVARAAFNRRTYMLLFGMLLPDPLDTPADAATATAATAAAAAIANAAAKGPATAAGGASAEQWLQPLLPLLRAADECYDVPEVTTALFKLMTELTDDGAGRSRRIDFGHKPGGVLLFRACAQISAAYTKRILAHRPPADKVGNKHCRVSARFAPFFCPTTAPRLALQLHAFGGL